MLPHSREMSEARASRASLKVTALMWSTYRFFSVIQHRRAEHMMMRSLSFSTMKARQAVTKSIKLNFYLLVGVSINASKYHNFNFKNLNGDNFFEIMTKSVNVKSIMFKCFTKHKAKASIDKLISIPKGYLSKRIPI